MNDKKTLVIENCTSIIVTNDKNEVLAVIDNERIVEANGIKVILSDD